MEGFGLVVIMRNCLWHMNRLCHITDGKRAVGLEGPRRVSTKARGTGMRRGKICDSSGLGHGRCPRSVWRGLLARGVFQICAWRFFRFVRACGGDDLRGASVAHIVCRDASGKPGASEVGTCCVGEKTTQRIALFVRRARSSMVGHLLAGGRVRLRAPVRVCVCACVLACV